MWKKKKSSPNPHRYTKVKVEDIHVSLKDYPPSGIVPPDNESFRSLQKHMRMHGILLPVFISQDKVLLSGHYRYWAWKSLGKELIPAIVVVSEKQLEWHLRYFFGTDLEGA